MHIIPKQFKRPFFIKEPSLSGETLSYSGIYKRTLKDNSLKIKVVSYFLYSHQWALHTQGWEEAEEVDW